MNTFAVLRLLEVVAQRCTVKKMFLEISQFCEISKNTFSYKTPLVAASGLPPPKLIINFKTSNQIANELFECV